jgi:hypothetical protein
VFDYFAGFIFLQLIDPFEAYWSMAVWQVNKLVHGCLPCLAALNFCE